jgi:3-oxoacyl-[acyl-carrier-protein] synthase-3
MQRIYSKITGTGRCNPPKILTNKDLEKIMDTTDEWIQSRTGIKQRHVAEDMTTVDMCEEAARKALDAANVSVDEIDCVIVGTTTPDQIFPNPGCLLQERLGIHGPMAFSLEAACTGFIYALSVADKFIRCGDVKKALVVGGERITNLLDWDDRSTAVLFGDGAGAVVIEASNEAGIISTHLHADGKYKDLLYYPAGIGKGVETFKGEEAQLRMSGSEVFKTAVKQLGNVVVETLEKNGLQKSDIDWLIPHQANMRIIKATAKKLNMPMERVVQTVQIHGNTSTASVPMALDVAIRDGRIKRGEMLLLEAFGGGFTWGSALVKY